MLHATVSEARLPSHPALIKAGGAYLDRCIPRPLCLHLNYKQLLEPLKSSGHKKREPEALRLVR